MKKEIPILFSTAMVQAILAGRKTMTRRVVKPHPADGTDISFMKNEPLDWKGEWFQYQWENEEGESIAKNPKWQPGDLLWVRETFRPIEQDFGEPRYEYKATEKINLTDKWKPSLFMPKEACRIWLEVTDVRAERLQDISEADAIAEGVERWVEERMKSRPTHYKIYCDLDNPNDPATYSSTAKVSFETLWHKINGKESWDANPWVWVVSFKVLSTTGKPEPTYTPSLIATPGEGAVIVEGVKKSRYSSELIEAAKLVVEYQAGSISLLQRKMKLGYNTCCNLMDELEKAKIVGPLQPMKPKFRYVLVESLFELELIFESNLLVSQPHLPSRGIDGHGDDDQLMEELRKSEIN